MQAPALVIGANGFLGSHITKTLVAQNVETHILVRESADTRNIDGLIASGQVVKHIGDVQDAQSLARAMACAKTIFYCVVDARAWLRDTSPLYDVNIGGLKNAIDEALAAKLERFVFTSTFAIIGQRADGSPADESDQLNWPYDTPIPDYIACREQAEQLVLHAANERGLPAVSCCVGNTYGPEDYQPTPHGKMLLDVAKGRLPVYWQGGGPTVDIRDAAEGMILAAQKGRLGERYIFGGPYLSFKALFALAAKAAGRKAPTKEISLKALYRLGAITELLTRPFGIENKLNKAAIDCSSKLPAISNAKAQTELGWQMRPSEQTVSDAVAWYLKN